MEIQFVKIPNKLIWILRLFKGYYWIFGFGKLCRSTAYRECVLPEGRIKMVRVRQRGLEDLEDNFKV
jgi:hypothetical protein